LVIDAALLWQKGTLGNEQKIKLSTTTGYFSNTIPTVSGALVYVKNTENNTFNFLEEIPGSGIYLCHDFIPEINKVYTLTVTYKGQTYTATETLKSVSPITQIEQNNNGGFTGNDIELKTYFNDPVNIDNFYMFKYKSNVSPFPAYDVIEDKFFQGNTFYGIYSNDKIKTGDIIDITIYGISKRYYEYINKLITIAGSNSGSPFATPPATVRGNIINQTNTTNYALGYFNVSETDYRNYIIQ
jgi:hypothetical protein